MTRMMRHHSRIDRPIPTITPVAGARASASDATSVLSCTIVAESGGSDDADLFGDGVTVASLVVVLASVSVVRTRRRAGVHGIAPGSLPARLAWGICPSAF